MPCVFLKKNFGIFSERPSKIRWHNLYYSICKIYQMLFLKMISQTVKIISLPLFFIIFYDLTTSLWQTMFPNFFIIPEFAYRHFED